MPIEGEQFDELLSGYLDGQLSDLEMEQVRAELEFSESARQQLRELEDLRCELKAHFASSQPDSCEAGPIPLGRDFTARVVAAAQAEAARLGLPEEHHVRKGVGSAENVGHPSVPAKRDKPNLRWQPVVLASAVLAASILLVLYLPSLLTPRSTGTVATGTVDTGGVDTGPAAEALVENRDPASGGAAVDPGPSGAAVTDLAGPTQEPVSGNVQLAFGQGGSEPAQYVSELNFGLTYLLVVDVEITVEAAQRAELQRILEANGILESQPIIANDEVQKVIADARMSVTEGGQDAASIYFMRAPIENLGAALDQIYKNQNDFPRVSFDLGFDSPQTRLMQTIARSTGRRFATNQKFAAPIVVGAGQSVGTQLSGVEPPQRYVSSSARSQGFGELPPTGLQSPATATSLETVLVIARIVGEQAPAH